MPLANTKQVQTIINVTAEQIIIVRAAIQTMKDTRTLFVAASVDTTGTPLSGSVASLNSALNTLDSAVNSGSISATWDALIGNYVPTHRKEAL